LERKGVDNEVQHRENITFEEFYAQFRALDDMTERHQMLDYVQKKGYLELSNNKGLSFGKPKMGSRVFKVLDPLDPKAKEMEFELQ
jgi:hypothetical protein